MPSTIEERIREAGREVGLRKSVYPGFVRNGKMTQEEADRRTEVMNDIYFQLKGMRPEPLPEGYDYSMDTASLPKKTDRLGDALSRSNWTEASHILTAMRSALDRVAELCRWKRATLQAQTEYPKFCSQPELCAGKGRCMRDPVCNE